MAAVWRSRLPSNSLRPVRVVLQRVSRAEVRIEGQVAGRIARGYLLLVGFGRDDDETTLAWMADKIVSLRLFPDDDGRMNRGIDEIGGGILVVSQFTLYGDLRKGRRPSFNDAARPEVAEPLIEAYAQALEAQGVTVARGRFGAHMDVELVNDGPVTLVLDSDNLDRARRAK